MIPPGELKLLHRKPCRQLVAIARRVPRGAEWRIRDKIAVVDRDILDRLDKGKSASLPGGAKMLWRHPLAEDYTPMQLSGSVELCCVCGPLESIDVRDVVAALGRNDREMFVP